VRMGDILLTSKSLPERGQRLVRLYLSRSMKPLHSSLIGMWRRNRKTAAV
jgi:hypothetical protein